MANQFLDEVIRLATPIIEAHDCELVDAEYKKEGPNRILRFYIELNEGHISLDECASVSNGISSKLDETDTIHENYILEVSSPGVNRVLKKEKDFLKFRGEKVDVSLYEAVDSRKKFACILFDYKNGVFTFDLDGEKMDIPRDKVSKINLHFEF